jgi:hypothetical protein
LLLDIDTPDDLRAFRARHPNIRAHDCALPEVLGRANPARSR